MGGIYYWSDLHFGHRFVAGLRGYENPDDHDQAIMEAWSRTVTEADTVYVLGDICGGSKHSSLKALDIIRDLPGTKRLIIGNHDMIHPMHRPRPADKRVWSEVFEDAQPYEVRKVNGQKFLLCHFPYTGDHTGEERYSQYRLPDLGLPLVHGHVHDAWKTNGRMLNVGVDHWRAPVPQKQVEAWITTL